MPGVVNPSSSPQRSPLRYPGGKTWLIPRARRWLRAASPRPRVLLDAFAGGGSIALLAAAEGLVDEVVMVERDPDVAALWRVALHGPVEDLARRVEGFTPDAESLSALFATAPVDDLDRAFTYLVRNRVAHGGIVAPRAGVIRVGEYGQGVASRWYPDTLARRLRDLVGYRDRVTFIEGDGLDELAARHDDPRVALFLDPPYSAAGKRAGERLYRYATLDHDRLLRLAAGARGPVLVTYDDTPETRERALAVGLAFRSVPMRTRQGRTAYELLIARDESTIDTLE